MPRQFRPHALSRGLGAGMLLLGMALWGCTGEEIAGLPGAGAGKKSPTPASTGLVGTTQTDSQASPTPSPTPTPTPSPTPTTTPTPDPEPTPFAIGITVSIATDSINLAPAGGGTPLYPFTTQMSGTVTMSNGHTTTTIDWVSSNPAIATVDSNGLVTAGSTVGGKVHITGKSKDGQVSNSVELTVTTFGGAEVDVD